MKRSNAKIGIVISSVFCAAALAGCLAEGRQPSAKGNDDKENPNRTEVSDGSARDSATDSSNAYAGGVRAKRDSRVITDLAKLDSCDPAAVFDKELMLAEIRGLLDIFYEYVFDGMILGRDSCPIFEPIEQVQSVEGAGGFGPMAPITKTTFSGGASKFSTTNLQVPGVDEADFVKNDDNTIYIIADEAFQIIDAWPPEQTRTVASVAVKGTPKKLYVKDDRAVIYSSIESDDTSTGMTILDSLRMLRAVHQGDLTLANYYMGYDDEPIERECTYGYSCEFRGDGNDLIIQTYDISNKTKPVLVRETQFGGSYLNSRRIGDIVHTMVDFSELGFSKVDYLFSEYVADLKERCCGSGTEWTCTDQEMLDRYDQLRADCERAVNVATMADFLPGFKDIQYSGNKRIIGEGLADTCNNIYLSSAGDGTDVVALISFDMSQSGPLGATAIVGKPGAVYASKEALYVASRHFSSAMSEWYYEDSETIKEATTVHKFALDPSSVQTTYAGSGVVKGRVLNQFSMDERDGYLRIATSNGQVPDPDVHSTLSVLQEQNGVLEIVGVVDEIAPTEDIRSVRFNGDVGFIVTFKKTDPLFVIDLSNPTRPAIKGELKVPGFATYMHLMDDKHLLTLGYDADEAKSGTFAWFQGLQLRVLDVSELDDPKVLSEVTIGTRGSTSDATTNHLAFNYFPQRDLLALPMTICEGGTSGGRYGDVVNFSGLLVYRVTVDEGFVLLGGVPHEELGTTWRSTEACNNWWTESNSKVKRSVFMSSESEDFVYSIAMDLINVSNLEDLENPLASVALVASE